MRDLALSDLPKLTSLAGIEALVSLQRLELAQEFAADPATSAHLAELPELVDLVLHVETVPAEITQLASLITLTLVGTQDLDAAFPVLAKLPALRILNVRAFDGELPESLGLLTGLERLECENGCAIRGLPRSIAKLRALRHLHLRHKLKKLRDELFECTALEELVLEGTQLTLSPKIGQLTALRTLDLRRTPMKQVPAQIGQLANLRVLRLWNKLAAIPNEVYALQLDEYDGPHDRFELREPEVPADSSVELHDGDRIPADLGHPRELRIRFSYAQTPLPQLARCTELRTLRATCNLALVVPYIPPSVTSLELSSLSHESHSGLPPLPVLETFKLETKAFGDLVLESPRLTRLTAAGRGTLAIRTTRLEELELARCDERDLLDLLPAWPLTKLHLRESRIDLAALCAALAGKSLESLSLIEMQIPAVPAAIGTLTVKELSLVGNPLTSVPAEIGQIRGLERLVLPPFEFDKRALPGRWKTTRRSSIVIFERTG